MQYESLIRSNLHTHTTFCDGKDTPEDIVKAAIEMGMETIGFSGHSYTPMDTSYCMSLKGTEQYCAEIDRLRREYRDQINVLCGIEMDLYGAKPNKVYDYIIGSVHYVNIRGNYCNVDHSADTMEENLQRFSRYDHNLYARDYFKQMAEMVEKTRCTIVGHFDLLTKYNEDRHFFNEGSEMYLKFAYEALDYLLERDIVFEINTGAIARGYRRTPYPAAHLLRYIAKKRGNVTITSDAHRKEDLMYAFPMALQIAKASGLGSVLTMTKDGWQTVPLY